MRSSSQFLIVPVLLLVGCSLPDGRTLTSPEAASAAIQQASASFASRSYANNTVNGTFTSVFVKYRTSAPADRLAKLSKTGVRSMDDNVRTRWVAVKVLPSNLATFQRDASRLKWVEQVTVVQGRSTIQGSSYAPSMFAPVAAARMFTETVPWGITNAGAPYAHAAGVTGDNVKVAILDTGFNCGHTDLDAHSHNGWDFIIYNAASGSCADLQTHGTGVAGIVGAESDNSYVIGMAPEADLYSVRVCDYQGLCDPADVAAGFDWAVTNDMDVINISVGACFLPNQPIIDAIEDAVAAGIIVVAGAGNGTADGGNCNYGISGYAAVTGVIAVGALLQGDTVGTGGYPFSSRIDLSAPAFVLTDSIGTVGMLGYTSAATPHVTGAVALMLSNGVPPAYVYSILTANARDLGATGKDMYFGYGAVDALSAAITAPQVSDVTACNSGPLYAGNCLLTPIRSGGVPVIQYRWEISYSTNLHSAIDTGWITDSTYSMPVPNGSYTITVSTQMREHATLSPRHRTGSKDTRYYPVCPGGGGGDDRMMQTLDAECP